MRKKTMLLLGFILLKFLMQYFLISPEYDLQRDEYLHLDQGRHLAWGFESVPPFTSWISWIIFHLDNNECWVKFFPALFGALTIFMVWKTIERLNGNLFAILLGVFAISFSVLPRINILYQPNSFDILSWTVLYYSLISYIKTLKNKWLYIAAIVFGIGFLNKYNIAFLIVGLLPGVLLTGTRKLFANKHLYIAMLLSLLIITPNLLWQIHNNFPVIHHMKELAETQLVNVQRADFIKEQLLFFIGSLFVIMAGLLSFFSFRDFAKYRFFFWSFFITLFVFIYLKAKGYYAIGLYPVLLAFGAVYLEWLSRNGWKKWLRPLMLLVPTLLFFPFIKRIFPVESPEQIVNNSGGKMHRWEDGKEYPLPQDFADMLGWKELAKKTDSVYRNIPDKMHTLILCDNYGEAGSINYYSKENLQALSLNADYINWFNLDTPIHTIIRIKENKDTSLVRERKIFDTIITADSIQNRFARERGTTIYYLSGPKTDINELLRKEIRKKKNS